VLPQPGDPGCAAGWAQLLSEIASLRIVDGSQANYYGFVNPGISAPFSFGITGISRLGDGAAVGIDETAAGWFENSDPGLDLPPGHLHFCFTVPASGELSGAEVRVPGGGSCRRARSQSLAARGRALDAAARKGSLVVREASGLLHLEWDARLHPYVNVIHQGARRTTLGLHLAGGSADVSLAGLPAGGRFLIHYSDGLNPVARTTPRR
jgi:hypothetical protein